MSSSQKAVIWKLRALAMFCSNSQVISSLGNNCFCYVPNVDRVWEMMCALLSGLCGFLRYVFVFEPIFPFISQFFTCFYHFNYPNIFQCSGEFSIFSKEYTFSLQKIQKANLFLSLLINAINSFKITWFKCNFQVI